MHLATAKTWVDIIVPIITVIGIVIGGIWAYYKFVKGRIFRPRVEIDMSGQWVDSNGKKFLQARIKVKNIGASKIAVKQGGTGFRVSVLAADQPAPPAVMAWEKRKTLAILKKHAWIESGETVSDDFMLDLGIDPAPVRFESRIVVPRRLFSNIAINAGQIISGVTANSTSMN